MRPKIEQAIIRCISNDRSMDKNINGSKCRTEGGFWCLLQQKDMAVCDCLDKRMAVAVLWSRRWERSKAVKSLYCSAGAYFLGGQHRSDGVPKQCTHPPLWGHFASRGHRWYRSSHCPPSYRLPAAEEWGNLEIGLQLLADTTSGSWCLGPGAAPTSQSSLKC